MRLLSAEQVSFSISGTPSPHPRWCETCSGRGHVDCDESAAVQWCFWICRAWVQPAWLSGEGVTAVRYRLAALMGVRVITHPHSALLSGHRNVQQQPPAVRRRSSRSLRQMRRRRTCCIGCDMKRCTRVRVCRQAHSRFNSARGQAPRCRLSRNVPMPC
jgi:hypothetical protein